MERRRKYFSAIVLMMMAMMSAGISCNDSIPVYHQPTGLFISTIAHIGDTDIEYISGDGKNNPDQENAQFRQQTAFEIVVVNAFDETLQGEENVSGWVDIAIRDMPFKQRIPITPASIGSSHVDPNGVITFNPGDTIKLKVYWNYKMNDTTWAHTKALVYSRTPVNVVEKFYTNYHLPLLFDVTSSFSLFKSIAPVSPNPISFTIRFTGKIYVPA